MESLKNIYLKCSSERNSYLERGRDSSALTVPTILPEEGKKSSRRFPTPYQSIGARGVNNLSSALLLALLPPNAPFFRLQISEEMEREMEQVDAKIKTEVENSLSEIERSIMDEVERTGIRTGLFDAVRHLVVTGNAMLYFPDGGNMRVVHLDRYVVKRCPLGNVRTVVLMESVSPSMLPEEIRPAVGDEGSYDDFIDLYTGMYTRNDGKVEVYQEINDVEIDGSRRVLAPEDAPFIPLRMSRVDGENYGRGYVEQYIGDLQSLEGLTKAIVEGSAAAAKVLFLVNPNGTTRARTLSESPNGAIREGSANDVSVLQSQKAADFSVALNTINSIQERLAYAFLLLEGSIRNADRVTAEEVRLVTQAVERQLGGIYSILSRELSLPLVTLVMNKMKTEGALPKLPNDAVKPVIITGIEALGRGNDLNRLDTYLAGIGQILGPEVLQTYVDVSEYLKRRAMALGIDTKGLVRSPEELAQMQQMQQQQMMMQQVAPQVMDQMAQGD
jgi:hypothetical protein|tara:strand:- start:20795 stop:22300 length:1506 start_codon:yes stop_codon:yes gene_type:complete